MQYLVFSRKERLGLTVLLVLIAAIWLLPIVFGRGSELPNEVLSRADSFRIARAGTIGDSGTIKIFELFPFDPNTIDDAGWQKLGLRQKTIATIRNYLSKGGRFRASKDLEKIYGLRPDEVERLLPYAQVDYQPNTNAYPSRARYDLNGSGYEHRSGTGNRTNGRSYSEPRSVNRYGTYGRSSNETRLANNHGTYGRSVNEPSSANNYRFNSQNVNGQAVENSKRRGSTTSYQRKTYVAFDINTADTSLFIALPGIGSKLALRIVQFREKLGGFYNIMQVGEVYGLQDSVFQIILPYLKIASGELRKININSLEFDSLNAHPYIQYLEARAIIQYRKQHGTFSNADDLLGIDILTREWLEKIRPYIDVDQGGIQKQ